MPITVIGSVNEDITLFASSLPRPGETLLAHSMRRGPGGKGANQAVAAARLSGGGRFVGAVGNDDAGDRMLAALVSAGVDVSQVARVGEATGVAYIVVDDAGENSIVVVAGANEHIAVPSSLPGPVLCQLEVPMEVVCAAARSTAGFFAVNAAPAQALPSDVIDRCDLIIVNENEYAALDRLPTARLVIVTLGSRGAIAVVDGNVIASAPGLSVEVVSSVGAGDAFCAAAVIALAQGWPVQLALATACAVGAAAVESSDAQPALGRLESYRPTAGALVP